MYALASRSTYSKEAEVTAQNLDATRSKLKKQVEDYTELKRVLLETEKTLDLTEKVCRFSSGRALSNLFRNSFIREINWLQLSVN